MAPRIAALARGEASLPFALEQAEVLRPLPERATVRIARRDAAGSDAHEERAARRGRRCDITRE